MYNKSSVFGLINHPPPAADSRTLGRRQHWLRFAEDNMPMVFGELESLVEYPELGGRRYVLQGVMSAGEEGTCEVEC
jgi:hypothetical protein